MTKVRNLSVGDKIRYRGVNRVWQVIKRETNKTVQIQRWTKDDGLVGNETRWLFDIDQDIEIVKTGD